MDIHVLARWVTLIVWVLALIGYIAVIALATNGDRADRFWYSFPMLTSIVFVIVLFIMFLVPGSVPVEMKNLLSKGAYLYLGITILFKEILAIYRRKVFRL